MRALRRAKQRRDERAHDGRGNRPLCFWRTRSPRHIVSPIRRQGFQVSLLTPSAFDKVPAMAAILGPAARDPHGPGPRRSRPGTRHPQIRATLPSMESRHPHVAGPRTRHARFDHRSRRRDTHIQARLRRRTRRRHRQRQSQREGRHFRPPSIGILRGHALLLLSLTAGVLRRFNHSTRLPNVVPSYGSTVRETRPGRTVVGPGHERMNEARGPGKTRERSATRDKRGEAGQ